MKFLSILPLTLLSLFYSDKSDKTENPSVFPVPPLSPNTLFYIQRSTNANTVMYEASMISQSTLNPKEPVQVYWLRYAEKGQKRELNFLERTVAYGVKCSPRGEKQYLMNFVASKNKWAEIIVDARGKAHAIMDVGGKKSKLNRIFVQVAEDGWWPKIDYIEFFGVDAISGEGTYERMKV